MLYPPRQQVDRANQCHTVVENTQQSSNYEYKYYEESWNVIVDYKTVKSDSPKQ